MATPSAVSQPAHGKRPTPERIFNALRAYEDTAVLKTAIELEVFTAIGEGFDTAARIAERVGAAERGIRVLCDTLVTMGFLNKEELRYGLTEESALFLDRRSPACLASMSQFLGSEKHRRNFDMLTQAVRKGGTAGEWGDNTEPNDELWTLFARSMAPLTKISAEFIAGLIRAEDARRMRVLDIAAGHGMYGVTIARKNPNAEIVAVDWPAVLQVAQENAVRLGVAERYHVKPGSAFDTDLGMGYDYVLLTNIFHHFDKPTCERLMRRVHSALKPDGHAITLEFVPNEDRVTPATTARFSLVMLANTDAGDAYTFSEYERMFRNAGFSRSTLHPVPEMPQQVVISEKAS